MYPKNNEKIMVDGAYLALANMNLWGELSLMVEAERKGRHTRCGIIIVFEGHKLVKYT